jgi:spoIIIJ-associated protein
MTNQQVQEKINTETLALIEEDTRHLLGIMGFFDARVSCTCKETKDKQGSSKQQLHINIDAKEAGRMLIGVKGNHLAALSHIVRSLLRRKLEKPTYITVDVNGYLASRERNLLSLAEEAARKAGRTGRAIVLPPMGASERHTIHTTLANRQDINTESLGDEPNRRVVVRPVFI